MQKKYQNKDNRLYCDEKLCSGLEDAIPNLRRIATKLLGENLAKNIVANATFRENALDDREIDDIMLDF